MFADSTTKHDIEPVQNLREASLYGPAEGAADGLGAAPLVTSRSCLLAPARNRSEQGPEQAAQERMR